MSKDWNEYEYCNSISLWEWIDEVSRDIELKLERAKGVESAEFKLVLLGKQEILDELIKWVHDNECTLGEIAQRWGLKPE